jgi:hypothetical protein
MSSEDNQEKEEKGFRVVDKRGGAAEQGEAASSKSEQPAQAEAQDQPEGAEQVEAVDVYGVLRYCIAMLQSHAWQAMGLVPNPVTNKIERNLEQAKVAIDCVGYLAQQLEPKAQPQELPHLRSLLSDLRVNFARQKSQPD